MGLISTDQYVGGGKGIDGDDIEYYINTVSTIFSSLNDLRHVLTQKYVGKFLSTDSELRH